MAASLISPNLFPPLASGELYEGWLFPDEGSKGESVIIDFNTLSNKIYALWGSVSSGKTVSSAIAWAGLVEKVPEGYPLGMIGKTERTLQTNVLDPLEEFLGPEDYELHGSIAYIYGHKIRLFGANDLKAMPKIKGATLYAWYGDEVTTWPEDFFMMALSRLRIPGARAILTTNPEGPYHWFYKNIIERANDPNIRAKFYKFTMDDNPYLPVDYKAWISSMYVPGTVWHRRWILGEWAAAEGAIFPFFTDRPQDGYVVDTIPQDLQHIIIPADYGQEHPTVFGFLGYSPSLKKWILTKEHYSNQKPNTEYSKEFKTFLDDKTPESVDVDTGGGGLSLLNQLRDDYPELDQTGAICHAIKVDVNAELMAVGSALYTHQLVIYRGCKRLIEELTNYVWDAKAKDRGVEAPVKVNDDGPDMLRYGWNRAQRLPI